MAFRVSVSIGVRPTSMRAAPSRRTLNRLIADPCVTFGGRPLRRLALMMRAVTLIVSALSVALFAFDLAHGLGKS